MIVLYDRKAVHDLIDKKGLIYSERPPNHVADIVTHGDSFAFMNYDNLYREQRKISSHNLSVRTNFGSLPSVLLRQHPPVNLGI